MYGAKHSVLTQKPTEIYNSIDEAIYVLTNWEGTDIFELRSTFMYIYNTGLKHRNVMHPKVGNLLMRGMGAYWVAQQITFNKIMVVDTGIVDSTNVNMFDKMLSIFTYIVDLDISSNPKITNVNKFGKTLKRLVAKGSSGITYNGLVDCESLTELDISDNVKISSFPFRNNKIRRLNIRGTRIGDFELQRCTDVEELNAFGNSNISLLGRSAQKLLILNIGWKCKVGDAALLGCVFLTELCAHDNPFVTTCQPFVETLRRLDASFSCGIDDEGIRGCDKLEVLDICANSKITKLPQCQHTLKYFYSNDIIDDEQLATYHEIIDLNVSFNTHITTCVSFPNLLKLNPTGSGITDDGVKWCNKLKKLVVDDDCPFTDFAPFGNSLESLSLYGCNNITDASLSCCVCIKKLVLNKTPNVTTCAPFAETLRILEIEDGPMNDYGIMGCVNLVRLNAANNPNITTLFMCQNTINSLDASGDCGLTENSIRSYKHLSELNTEGNRKITSTAHPFFARFKNNYDDDMIWFTKWNIF